MGKSTTRTTNYRQDASRRVIALATFQQQMADFARADQLVQLRERKRLSQENAAHEIGVSAKSLRAWEHGGGIRWHNVKKLAAFYGVKPESLVVQEPDRAQPTPDLMPSLNGNGQLDRIEAMLRTLLRHAGYGIEFIDALADPAAPTAEDDSTHPPDDDEEQTPGEASG